MSIEFDEIDKFFEEMEEEYQELFPPKKRRFTFTEVREKYRKKRKGGDKEDEEIFKA